MAACCEGCVPRYTYAVVFECDLSIYISGFTPRYSAGETRSSKRYLPIPYPSSTPPSTYYTTPSQCQTPPLSSPEFDWKMYRYTPTLAGAIVALLVFLIMALLHTYQYPPAAQPHHPVRRARRAVYVPQYLPRSLVNTAKSDFQLKSAASARGWARASTTRRGARSSRRACCCLWARCSSPRPST